MRTGQWLIAVGLLMFGSCIIAFVLFPGAERSCHWDGGRQRGGGLCDGTEEWCVYRCVK